MKEVHIPDDGGDTMTGVEYNGCTFPKFPDLRGLEGFSSVKIRDDDILLCTYPKSGTHWIFEIIRELLSGEIIDDTTTKGSTFMEMYSEETYADLPSPRILNTHAPINQLPADVLKKKIKIIHLLRNPKDVAVSCYNFSKALPYLDYKGKWENYLRPHCQGKFLYGSWFDYVKAFEEMKKETPKLPLINLFYEDFKQDQIREMRKLCLFLGVERSDEFLSNVGENTTLDHMRTQKAGGAKVIFRKGEVGDWKNWFTVAQNEWFDQLYQEKMKDSSLKFKFTDDELASD